MEWIVTDNIYRETWRRLLEYSNVELTVDQIARRHGLPKSAADRSNYLKQARQARVSILQAKEYFDAAQSSSIYTSPNHAYYGAVATASMMMLVLGDGTYSLDYLRGDARNSHHGLEFTTGCNAKRASTALTWVENSFARVLPHGHFRNWYSTLPRIGQATALVTREIQGGALKRLEPSGQYKAPTAESLIGTKRSVDLLKHLPDLSVDLSRYGIHVPRSRSTHEVKYKSNGWVRHTWTLHGAATLQDRDAILEQFAVFPRFTESLSCTLDSRATSAIISLAFQTPTEIGFRAPSSREST